MVRDYKKRPSYISAQKYRNPKIFGQSRREPKKKFELPNINFRLIFFLIIFGLLTYFVFFSPQTKIKSIIVEGASIVSKDQIVSALPLGQNIFLFNVDENKVNLLNKFPELKQVEIYRGIPDTLKIVVLEREGKIVWQSGSDKYLISSDGDVAKKISDSEVGNMPIVVDTKSLAVKVGDNLVSANFVAFVSNVYNSFYSVTGIKPTGFEVPETTLDVNLKTDAGFYVKLNSLRSSQKQLDNLKLVLTDRRADIHEYVDLRIDGWAYIK